MDDKYVTKAHTLSMYLLMVVEMEHFLILATGLDNILMSY